MMVDNTEPVHPTTDDMRFVQRNPELFRQLIERIKENAFAAGFRAGLRAAKLRAKEIDDR